MNDHIEKTNRIGEGDLPGDLDTLRGVLDGLDYPGRAWPAVRLTPRKRLWPWLIAVSAAAAAVVLAVALHRPAPQPTQTAPVAAAESVSPDTTWTIPTGIDPALAGRMTFKIPAGISIKTVGEKTARFEFKIPTVSFPKPRERSRNHENKKNSRTADDDCSGGLAGNLYRSQASPRRA